MLHRVKVTEEDILNGTSSGYRCPVNLACNRIGLNVAYVGMSLIIFRSGNNINTPPLVRNFIRRFDSGDNVDPEEFIINIPDNINAGPV